MSRSRKLYSVVVLIILGLGVALGGLGMAHVAAARAEPNPVALSEASLAEAALRVSAPLTTPTVSPATITPTPAVPRVGAFRLSATPGGPAQLEFPAGTSAIYVNYTYDNFTQPYTVTVQLRDVYGLTFWRSDRSYTGQGTEVLTVTAQDVYSGYLSVATRGAELMLAEATRAVSSTNLSGVQFYLYNALAAGRDIETALQQLVRYMPDQALPQLAGALSALHDAQTAANTALQAGLSLAEAQARARIALQHVTRLNQQVDTLQSVTPTGAAQTLPGTVDEPHSAIIRIAGYPAQSINEWVVQNPAQYRRLAAPLRRGLPDRLTIIRLTNLSTRSANVTLQYFPASGLGLLATQSVQLGPRASTGLNVEEVNGLPANYTGYAVILADVPLGVVVSEQAPREPTPTATPTPFSGGPTGTSTPTGPTPTRTLTPTTTTTPTAGPSPTLCPQATPELLAVEPVLSPTDQLTQTITVRIGNGDAVTVTTASGVFVQTGAFDAYSNPARVVVQLLPNTTHDLTVYAHVRPMSGPGGCPYGNYTLSTTRDRQGNPLRIVQQGGTVVPGVTPTQTPPAPTRTPTPLPSATHTATPIPTPTYYVINLTPAPEKAGYVTSQFRDSAFFGTRTLWAGMDTRAARPLVMHGVFQFDLSSVPPQPMRIVRAELILRGSDRTYLDVGTVGQWRAKLLDSSVDMSFNNLNYYQIHNAPVDGVAEPVLRLSDLVVGQTNTLTLTGTALDELNSRVRTTRRASFRLDLDSVSGVGRAIFGWDARPILRLYTQAQYGP